MTSLLLSLLSIALLALTVGFARQEERRVKVLLKSSVRLRGKSYHPNSQGVEMPISHARAIGFDEDDFLGEEPEEEEDSSESKSEGESGDEDTGTSSAEDNSGDGNESEPEGSKEEPEEEGEPIPDDTPEHDKLIKDERFATVDALLENQDQLTDINGIGPATAESIIEHLKPKEG